METADDITNNVSHNVFISSSFINTHTKSVQKVNKCMQSGWHSNILAKSSALWNNQKYELIFFIAKQKFRQEDLCALLCSKLKASVQWSESIHCGNQVDKGVPDSPYPLGSQATPPSCRKFYSSRRAGPYIIDSQQSLLSNSIWSDNINWARIVQWKQSTEEKRLGIQTDLPPDWPRIGRDLRESPEGMHLVCPSWNTFRITEYMRSARAGVSVFYGFNKPWINAHLQHNLAMWLRNKKKKKGKNALHFEGMGSSHRKDLRQQ